MKNKTVFVKVFVKDEFPILSGNYHTSIGYYYYTEFYEEFKSDEDPEWWLKEIELPSDEEIHNFAIEDGYSSCDNSIQLFKCGVDYILNKLK